MKSKSFLSVLIFFALFVFHVSIVFAHGGVSKNIGGTTVFLKQNPLSPKVGEHVAMSFRFAQTGNNQALKNTLVDLEVVQTFFGDESKDTSLLTTPFTTDANGNISFEHTFVSENYFDIELSFVDPVTKKEQVTGFLVQVRDDSSTKKSAVCAVLCGIFAGLIIAVTIWVIHTYRKNRKVDIV